MFAHILFVYRLLTGRKKHEYILIFINLCGSLHPKQMKAQISYTGSTFALVRDARRRRGMTQAALAEAVDCTQSAISMFENGRADVLAREKITAIEHALDIVLPDLEPAVGRDSVRTALKHCPNFECPSSTPYLVGPHLCCRPDIMSVEPGVRYCAWCGEVLVDLCHNPECRAPLMQGSFCPDCGTPYVPLPAGWRPEPHWVKERWLLKERLSSTDLLSTQSSRSGGAS